MAKIIKRNMLRPDSKKNSSKKISRKTEDVRAAFKSVRKQPVAEVTETKPLVINGNIKKPRVKDRTITESFLDFFTLSKFK